MKIFKAFLINSLVLTSLMVPQVAYAQTVSGDVNQIVTFLRSIVGVLATLGGIVSVIFFAWGGFGYMTSSGNPESLEKSKQTIKYAAVGLVIVLGAYVFVGIVSQLTTAAFGSVSN